MPGALPRVAVVGSGGSVPFAALGVERALHRAGLNTGNLLFQHVVWSSILNPKVLVSPDFPPTCRREDVDVLVIPAANQLNPETTYELTPWLELIEFFDKPVVVVGLGAQAWTRTPASLSFPQHVQDFVRAVARRSEAIGVRGPFSAMVAGALGAPNVTVTGCPSIHLNPGLKGQAVEACFDRLKRGGARRLAFLPGTLQQPTRAAEAHLLSMAALQQADLIYQSNAELFKAVRGEPFSEKYLRWEHIHMLPHMSYAAYRAYIETRGRFYSSAVGWMDDMRRYDLVFGMRLHGAVAAVQGGTAGLCVTFDSRTEELAETMGLPRAQAQSVMNCRNLDELMGAVVFDAAHFDHQREVQRREMGRLFATADVRLAYFQD